MWKWVQGYEGLYEVSDTGDVRSVSRKSTGNRDRVLHGRLLSQAPNEHGYMCVVLCKDGIRHTKKVHRLVAQAFVENKDSLNVVNHKDCNILNNSAGNLEWCTQQYNIIHAYKNGRVHHDTLLSTEQVAYIMSNYKPYSRTKGLKHFADLFNVSTDVVRYAVAVRGKNL